jgi:hypothetical protein
MMQRVADNYLSTAVTVIEMTMVSRDFIAARRVMFPIMLMFVITVFFVATIAITTMTTVAIVTLGSMSIRSATYSVVIKMATVEVKVATELTVADIQA